MYFSDGTWAYSHELHELFPEQPIAGLHAIVGSVVDIGTAAELDMPAQIAFATHDSQRREAFLRGEYSVPIAARFIDARGMQAVVDQSEL